VYVADHQVTAVVTPGDSLLSSCKRRKSRVWQKYKATHLRVIIIIVMVLGS
jgi:hypothetical protein